MMIKKFLNAIEDEELSIKLSQMNDRESNVSKYSKITNEIEVLVDLQFIDHGQREFDNLYF